MPLKIAKVGPKDTAGDTYVKPAPFPAKAAG